MVDPPPPLPTRPPDVFPYLLMYQNYTIYYSTVCTFCGKLEPPHLFLVYRSTFYVRIQTASPQPTVFRIQHQNTEWTAEIIVDPPRPEEQSKVQPFAGSTSSPGNNTTGTLWFVVNSLHSEQLVMFSQEIVALSLYLFGVAGRRCSQSSICTNRSEKTPRSCCD